MLSHRSAFISQLGGTVHAEKGTNGKAPQCTQSPKYSISGRYLTGEPYLFGKTGSIMETTEGNGNPGTVSLSPPV
ncbi:MAG: hypothetical protein ACYDBK_07620 [Thermoplasmataceae archaeon]